ncbi:MAG: toll/interleukin-1 receptor domain-containing protein [Candidatus Hodarchaeota archaeon]
MITEIIAELVAGIIIGIFSSSFFSILKRKLSKRKNKRTLSINNKKVVVDLSNDRSILQTLGLLSGKPLVFLAYSFKDKDFVERLSNDLQQKDIRTWLAHNEIKPGDNWKIKIDEALQKSGYLLAVISKSSIKSTWTQNEFQAALKREQKGKWPHVIPILIENVPVPEYIQDKIYIDFQHNYDEAFENIINVIKGNQGFKY